MAGHPLPLEDRVSGLSVCAAGVSTRSKPTPGTPGPAGHRKPLSLGLPSTVAGGPWGHWAPTAADIPRHLHLPWGWRLHWTPWRSGSIGPHRRCASSWQKYGNCAQMAAPRPDPGYHFPVLVVRKRDILVRSRTKKPIPQLRCMMAKAKGRSTAAVSRRRKPAIAEPATRIEA